MSSDELISTGDDRDYGILDEEKDPIPKNDLVWVKTKKEMCARQTTQDHVMVRVVPRVPLEDRKSVG